jgi:tetratricopeptide (TPR) repeat protein
MTVIEVLQSLLILAIFLAILTNSFKIYAQKKPAIQSRSQDTLINRATNNLKLGGKDKGIQDYVEIRDLKSKKIFIIASILLISVILALNYGSPTQDVFASNSERGMLDNQSNYSGAVQAYDKAIEINPENATFLYSKGVALEYQSKHVQAIKALDEAIELKPNYADAWDCKGFALHTMGKTREAENAIGRANAIRLKT